MEAGAEGKMSSGCGAGVPEQADLERELFFVKQKWYNIGLQLGVSDIRLEEIECECGSNFEKGLRLMLRDWRKRINPEARWKALVLALRQCTVNEQDLAANLEERYVSSESVDLHQPHQLPAATPTAPYPLDCSVVMKPEEVPDPEVQKELSHLYDTFDDLVMDVYNYLSTHQPDLKEFAVLVSSQPPSWQVKRPKLIPDVHFERIIDPSTDFFTIFCIVRRYVSWHNYELMEKIVKRYGDSNLKQQMENYCSQLNHFEEHTSAEVLKNIPFAIAQADSVVVQVVLPNHHLNQFTGGEIRQFKHKITEKANLEKSSVRTYMINESSVKIIFLIPRALAPYVMVNCSLPVSPLLTTDAPLPESISDRTVYTMHTEEVFRIIERTVAPPALQKSTVDADVPQMSRSTSRVLRLASSASESSSRLTEAPLSTIDTSLVHLHHHKIIMRGDNAVICKAHFLSLPCAAKYVHPELAKSSTWQVESFHRGCQLLQGLSHPNIVTILGICCNESVVGPIILMEKMEQNLNDFLNKGVLPLHTQIDILSDVSHGLEYLHANDILHGNLTATNVLISGGRAKIGGVTSLQFNSTDAELSLGSGAAVSLPRKSFSCAIYDEAIDSFSFGVLSMHVVTQEMPQPLTKILEPENATISEVNRYKKSLDGVNEDHPLRQLIIQCLKDVPFQRPQAKEICKQVSAVITSTDYQDSQRADENLSNEEILQAKNEECRQLYEMLAQKEKDLQQKESMLCQAEQGLSEAQFDLERVQTTLTALTLRNEDLEKEVDALKTVSKNLSDKVKAKSSEKTKMLEKIHELEKDKARYKEKSEEADRGYARLLSQQ